MKKYVGKSGFKQNIVMIAVTIKVIQKPSYVLVSSESTIFKFGKRNRVEYNNMKTMVLFYFYAEL